MIATLADALAAIESLPSAPRDLPCPGCPSGTALERLTMHRHLPGRVEASAAGATRWWVCQSCGLERALDCVAVALPPRVGEAVSC